MYNNKKGNFKKKKNIKLTTLYKEFTSFSEAINEMKDNCPVIAELLNTNEDAPSVESVYSKVAELAVNNTPNLTKRENMLWEFNISGNRISVKTDKYLSFGWIVKSLKTDTDDSSVYQNYYNCRITLFGDNQNDIIDNLLKNDWVTKEGDN